jgi:hypothetical protein
MVVVSKHHRSFRVANGWLPPHLRPTPQNEPLKEPPLPTPGEAREAEAKALIERQNKARAEALARAILNGDYRP